MSGPMKGLSLQNQCSDTFQKQLAVAGGCSPRVGPPAIIDSDIGVVLGGPVIIHSFYFITVLHSGSQSRSLQLIVSRKIKDTGALVVV